MHHIKDVADVSRLGTILSVWAHPDDESFSCAGIMCAAIKNGQRVVCVTATKGEAGVQDESRWPASQLADIRANEMKAALKIIGINEHYWLGYGDGNCAKITDKEGQRRIKKFIDDVKPDSILTFGPDGLTGHPDHQAVSRWVNLATKGTNVVVYHVVESKALYEKYLKPADEQFNIFFNIDKPPIKTMAVCDISFRLTPDLVDQKHQALAAMPSQTEAMLRTMPKEVFACECFIRAT